jgi:ABC-type branched-subunit amino acid transport system substrate-binding protein
MKNLLLSLCALLMLAACGPSNRSTGYDSRNPWERNTPQEQAQATPDALNQRDQWLAGQSAAANAGTTIAATDPSVTQYPLPPADGATAQPDSGFSTVIGHAGIAEPNYAKVKVAILVPLSGSSAAVGEAIMNAAQLALFDIGADSFELLPHDTQGTAAGAAMAAQSAIHDGAQMILGPLFAEEVRAAAPIAAAANINMVSFTTDWKQAGNTTFVMGFMPFGQVQRVVDYAASRGMKRIGVIAPQSEYGNAVMSAYQAAASRAGVTTIDLLRFRPGDTNLSVPVQGFAKFDARKLANGAFAPAPFDAVFLPAGGNDARSIASLLSYYELDATQVKRLGTGLWDDGSLSRETHLNGGWFAAPDPAARRNFEAKYQNAYGSTPPRLASLGYDATALAAVLAKTGQKNSGVPAFNRAAMTNPNGFAGIDGIFRFRSDGLAERGLAILEMRNGQTTVIDPAPKTFQ